ncbi:MAG: HNH endonuclease signature motif containing protein [Candidatus Omnitrophica bacterium]|nr:HNH endonuclease signature motif containing protein [Candidatus Omnitrophota bacterium]
MEVVVGEQGKEFREFWQAKVLDNNYPELSESDMNRIILFFDDTAKGSKEFRESGGVACAKANLRMPQWYKVLRDLKNKQDIREITNQILMEKDDKVIMDLLDELEKINKGNRNGLTGWGTVALSAILFTYNPDRYLAMLHFIHRLNLISFFGLGDINNYRSYGEKIVRTNSDIISGFNRKFGIETTPYKLSFFTYCQLADKYNWNNWKKIRKDVINGSSKTNSYSEASDLNIATMQRERIPERIKYAVWRRDKGRCAECGSREKLEYDHIIPISKGGSNTIRNIELLCESCNRKKSSRI